MKRVHSFFIAAALFSSCADKPHPENEPVVLEDTTTSIAPIQTGRIEFLQVDDNVKHDTLLIQTTFDLNDGSFLMVASHINENAMEEPEERIAGLRLYHYRPAADSSANILAISSPAYDSWTMFPTFFADPLNEGSQIILANFGERNSWGQKVIRFGEGEFEDLGFLNVAGIERIADEDGERLKLVNIARNTTVSAEGGELVFAFDADEIMLYDDLRGVLEQPIDAGRVTYRWNATDGMQLYIDGEERRERPAG